MKEQNVSTICLPEGRDKMDKRIRIMLVDDNEVFRYGLRLMLEQEKDTEVVGDCADADEAIIRIQNLNPDIVLIAFRGQNRNCIETIWRVKRSDASYKGDVIVLADSDSDYTSASDAGAAGYLINKDMTCTKLTQAIRNIHAKRAAQEGTAVELVRLVVPPPFDLGQFLRFTNQIETILLKDSNNGCIDKIAGSFQKGAAITVSLGQMSTCEFLSELNHMPSVQKVAELTLTKVVTPVPGDQNTTVQVTLREPFTAAKTLVTAAS
jgi:CheY-like chemotaxis protein